MNRRERVLAALDYRPVDRMCLDIDVSGAGLYEHGEKLRELLETVEGDFHPISDFPIPVPPPEAFDENGRYHEFRTDAWGVLWEYRIVGMHGHPYRRPLDDWRALDTLRPAEPVYPPKGTPAFDWLKKATDELRKDYFKVAGWIGTFEVLHALRKFDDVLAEVADGDENLVRLADRVEGVMARDVRNLIDLDVDMITYAEDFGMNTTMLISPEDYRRFFKPRQARLIAPARQAGKKIWMHSCGHVLPILEDYREIGVDAIWPQVTAYDVRELAARCRSLGIAVAVAPCRHKDMTVGSPDDVRRFLDFYAEAFRPWEGGSWFYIEIDNGFPFDNIVALVEFLAELRK